MNAPRPIFKSPFLLASALDTSLPFRYTGSKRGAKPRDGKDGKNMKKWIALMMACLLCGGLFLTGCGKKENPDSWKNEAYDLSLPTLGQEE